MYQKQVDGYVRTLKFPRVIRHGSRMFEEDDFLYADAAFFSVFNFPLLSGDPQQVLDGAEKMVITQSMAQNTGVAADPPENSQIRFGFAGSFATLNAAKTEKWKKPITSPTCC